MSRPDLFAHAQNRVTKRRQFNPIRMFVMSVLGALVAFVIVFVLLSSDHDDSVLDAVRRGLGIRPRTLAQSEPKGTLGLTEPKKSAVPEPKKIKIGASKVANGKDGKDLVSVPTDAHEKKRSAPLLAGRTHRPDADKVTATPTPKTAKPQDALTEHERWYLQIAESQRDYQIRELSESIAAATMAAEHGQTQQLRDEARHSLVDLRNEADDVLSRRIQRAPKLPHRMFAVGLVGSLERGAIRVKRVIDESKMIVELFSGVKDNGPTSVLDEDSILNEGHPVLLCGVSTENVVDGARMLLSDTLVVSGTYRDSSGTIYRVEPLKADSERIVTAFDQIMKADEQDPVKRERIARLRNAIAHNHVTEASSQNGKAAASAPETIVHGPTDQNEAEAAAARPLFEAVTDREPLSKIEMPAYWRCLKWARAQSFADLERRGEKHVVSTQFWQEPDKYRGKLIRLRLHVARILTWDAGQNSAGVKHVYEVWGWTDESKSFPYLVILSELPTWVPLGDGLHEEGVFVGYFLKTMAYTASNKNRSSPLLLGRMKWTVEPRPPSFDQEAREKPGPRWPAENLANAKNLVSEKLYKAARRLLHQIIDEAPLTNESIEAQRLLQSLPPEEKKAETYLIP